MEPSAGQSFDHAADQGHLVGGPVAPALPGCRRGVESAPAFRGVGAGCRHGFWPGRPGRAGRVRRRGEGDSGSPLRAGSAAVCPRSWGVAAGVAGRAGEWTARGPWGIRHSSPRALAPLPLGVGREVCAVEGGGAVSEDQEPVAGAAAGTGGAGGGVDFGCDEGCLCWG